MEQRLDREQEPMMLDAEIDEKLFKEKMVRWKYIEVLLTLRDSAYLGIQDEILRRSPSISPLMRKNSDNKSASTPTPSNNQ